MLNIYDLIKQNQFLIVNKKEKLSEIFTPNKHTEKQYLIIRFLLKLKEKKFYLRPFMIVKISIVCKFIDF